MSRNWNRDDPVLDAEDYANRSYPTVGTCECCQMPIYEGLSYIDMGGVLFHNEIECIVSYCREFKVNG